MIKKHINVVKKAAKRIWKNTGESMPYYNAIGVIEVLEKLDSGEELDNADIAYIHYPFYLFEGDIKKIGEWYSDYYK